MDEMNGLTSTETVMAEKIKVDGKISKNTASVLSVVRQHLQTELGEEKAKELMRKISNSLTIPGI